VSWIGKVFAAPADVDRAKDEVAGRLGVATITAAMHEPWGRDHLMDCSITRISGEGTIAGRAVTAWNPPGTNTMVRFGIEACGPGDVMVMTTPTDGAAQWGDLAHDWATARGLAGVIVDGSVRDVDQVRTMKLSLWARSIDPRQALKSAHGYVNAPIKAGGQRICPGGLIVADGDGVLVIPIDDVAVALQRGTERDAKERESRKDLVKGQRSPHLTAIFDSGGIAFLETTWRQL
jgi:4-hydroxy-4-methyl-2-oxoglutarate aldolase